MVKEQSIKDQIRSMEGWAIKGLQKEEQEDYDGARKLLKLLQVQARKLERTSGKNGLKHLPKLEEVNILKMRVTESRAATGFLMGCLGKIQKLKKKETEKEDEAELAAIRQEEKGYIKEVGKYSASLVHQIDEARKIVDLEPWINPIHLARSENMDILWEFLRRDGYYEHLSNTEFTKIIDTISRKTSWSLLSFSHARLNGAILNNLDFRLASITDAHCRKTDFSGSIFYKANLSGSFVLALFVGADLTQANLHSGYFQEADFAGADFKDARLSGANLDGANLKDVKNLTKDQLHSANKWNEAKNIPKELL